MDEPQQSDDLLKAKSYQLKADEYLAGWKRAQADYQNLIKDVAKEKTDFAKYANERLLGDLLPSLDQFELALSHAPATSLASDVAWQNWLNGIKAVQAIWEQTFAAAGLKRVPTDGAFNPAMHEAVGEEVADGQPPGVIVRVISAGWQLGDKILRPAKVILAKS